MLWEILADFDVMTYRSNTSVLSKSEGETDSKKSIIFENRTQGSYNDALYRFFSK